MIGFVPKTHLRYVQFKTRYATDKTDTVTVIEMFLVLVVVLSIGLGKYLMPFILTYIDVWDVYIVLFVIFHNSFYT